MQPQEFIRRLCQSTVGDQLIKNIRKNFGREFKINDCNSINLQMDPSGEYFFHVLKVNLKNKRAFQQMVKVLVS